MRAEYGCNSCLVLLSLLKLSNGLLGVNKVLSHLAMLCSKLVTAKSL